MLTAKASARSSSIVTAEKTAPLIVQQKKLWTGKTVSGFLSHRLILLQVSSFTLSHVYNLSVSNPSGLESTSDFVMITMWWNKEAMTFEGHMDGDVEGRAICNAIFGAWPAQLIRMSFFLLEKLKYLPVTQLSWGGGILAAPGTMTICWLIFRGKCKDRVHSVKQGKESAKWLTKYTLHKIPKKQNTMILQI